MTGPRLQFAGSLSNNRHVYIWVSRAFLPKTFVSSLITEELIDQLKENGGLKNTDYRPLARLADHSYHADRLVSNPVPHPPW